MDYRINSAVEKGTQHLFLRAKRGGEVRRVRGFGIECVDVNRYIYIHTYIKIGGGF